MLFDAYGPFEMERELQGQWRAAFWNEVEEYCEGLSSAIGCYVFCTTHGETAKPWYVGKTLNQDGFRGEVFEPHKVLHYQSVMTSRKRSKPHIFLFPLVTDTFAFSENRSGAESVVDWLETMLIGMALSQNPDIMNTGKTMLHRNVYVNGVLGPQFQGKPTHAASFARKLFLG